MWSPLTIKDVTFHRKVKKRMKGAVLDFRWTESMSELEKVLAFETLKALLKKHSLTLSGYGATNFKGILSSAHEDKQLDPHEVKLIFSWRRNYMKELKYFNIGRIQWIDEIYFE